MSDILYLNKAKRLSERAENLIKQFKKKIINSITEGQDSFDLVQINKQIDPIFDEWLAKSTPIYVSGINGKHLLVFPEGGVRSKSRGKNKSKNLLSLRVTGARFIILDNGAMTLYRSALNSNNSSNRSYSNVVEYFADIVNEREEIRGMSKFGKNIKDYDHNDFVKFLTRFSDHRYTGNDSVNRLLTKNLLNVLQSHHSKYHNLAAEVTELIKECEELFLLSATMSLMAHINRKALRATGLNKNSTLEHYQWLCNSKDDAVIDKRLGAYMSYPAFMPFFINIEKVSSNFNHYQSYSYARREPSEPAVKKQEVLTNHIDEGLSVPNALKNVFSSSINLLPKKYLAPYHGVSDSSIDSHSLRIFAEHIDSLRLVPRSEYPIKQSSWSGFKDSSRSITSASERTKLSSEFLVSNDGFYNVDIKFWEDIGDFTNKIFDTILLPTIIQLEKEYLELGYLRKGDVDITKLADNKKIRDVFFSIYTPSQIIRASKDWHDRLDTVNSTVKSFGIGSAFTWPELVPELIAPNGAIITPLTSKDELEAEGKKMDHCVGGYSWNCIFHGSHIFHLSHENESSTLQLKELEDKPGKIKLKMIQNKAYHNAPPSQALKQAAEWLVKSINDGSLEVDWDALNAGREIVQTEYNKNQTLNKIGFDAEDRDVCIQVYEVYKRFLPKRMQNLSYDEFVEQSGLRAEIFGEMFDRHIEAAQRAKKPANFSLGYQRL